MPDKPSFDEYFLNLAMMVATRSSCCRRQVGAIIVKDNHILSTGYNGAPRKLDECLNLGCWRDQLQIASGHDLQTCRAVHAEQNAIIQASKFGLSITGSTVYCTHTPCRICANMLINAGIKKYVTYGGYPNEDFIDLFNQAGIEFVKMDKPDINLNLKNRTANFTDTSLSNTPVSSLSITNHKNMADIFIYDQFSPEDTAMMQALYSRSSQSVQTHVEKVKKTGSGKFMEQYYVGYGHNSIADCGSTTIFIENISILADKAVQDWPLYSGQETSTRYIDMSQQPIVDPVNTTESQAILQEWMQFYVNNQEQVKEHLKQNYPAKPEEDIKVYNKAIAARCFDIMRGFLPAGICTQLSWHTNLRQAWDKLALLRFHPLTEVQEIAQNMLATLQGKYKHSFCHNLIPDQENYRQTCTQQYNYYQASVPVPFACHTSIDSQKLYEYKDILDTRPPKTNLPHFLTELGLVTFDFILDFGSFRDIQRHRNGVCRMPLLTTNLGFNAWYLNQLPATLQIRAKELISQQTQRINALTASDVDKQYYIAMGFNITGRISYGLPATIYTIELRSNKSVHPSLRRLAWQMHHALVNKFPFLTLHSDLDQDDWEIRRGLQDITKREF